jgi:hypothetical protein
MEGEAVRGNRPLEWRVSYPVVDERTTWEVVHGTRTMRRAILLGFATCQVKTHRSTRQVLSVCLHTS